MVDHDGDQNGGGGGDSGVPDIRSNYSDGRELDGAESIAGDNDPVVSSETSQHTSRHYHFHHNRHGDGTMPEEIVEGEKEARLRTKGPQPAGIRVGVWDTATAALGPQNPLIAATGPGNRVSNHLPINGGDNNATRDSAADRQRQLQEHPPEGKRSISMKRISSTGMSGDGEAAGPGGDAGKPYAYENLLEEPETRFLAASSTATARSCYPKVVDRNGLTYSDLGGRPAGVDSDGRHDGEGSVNTTSGTTGPEEADGSLAAAAEESLSLGGSNA